MLANSRSAAMVPTALSAQPELMAQACTQGRSPLQVCRAASPVHTPKRNRALLAPPVNTLAAVRQCVLAGGVVRLDCDSLPHSSTAATSFEAHCSACGSLTAEPDRWRSVRYFGAAESSGGTMGHADLLEDQLRVCRLQLVDVPRLPPINTQHSTVGCCASVSVGAVAQHRCGRAANAHTYLVVAALHVRRRAHVVPEGDRPVRADVLLAAQHVNPAEPVVPLHGANQPDAYAPRSSLRY